MRTLVTGGTGLVGNNVLRLLVERGEEVRALARPGSDPRPFEGVPVEIVPGDVTDAASVREACRDVLRVIHAAARVHIGWTGLELQQHVNVEGSRNVAIAAREAGARMVHVSSVDALGLGTRETPANEETPIDHPVPCPYVLTKRAAEQAVLEEVERGLDAVIVNPVFMLGPWDWKPSSGRMLLEVARGWALIAPPGGNDFCDVRDVAAGALTAAERGQRGRRYILGGEPLLYFDAWTLFAKVANSRGPLREGRKPMMKLAGKAGDLWATIRRREGDVNSAATQMACLPHHYSYRRAAEELGYQPRSTREAAEAAWAWFVERGYAKRK